MRSRSTSARPALTVPVGPLLRTEARSWSRSRGQESCESHLQHANIAVGSTCSGTQAVDTQVSEESLVQKPASSVVPSVGEPQTEPMQHGLDADIFAHPEKSEAGSLACAVSEASQAVSTTSTLLEYLPETPQRGIAAATPESRAESRKQEVLDKVAQQHADVRKQHFIFGKKTVATPVRLPMTEKKVDTTIHK